MVTPRAQALHRAFDEDGSGRLTVGEFVRGMAVFQGAGDGHEEDAHAVHEDEEDALRSLM